MSGKTLGELMAEYEEKFDDLFPLMLCMDMTEEEQAEQARRCIEDGTPLTPEEDAYY